MSRWKSGWAATVWGILMALSASLPAQTVALNTSSGDYARVDVPDVAQAVRFFSEVMNCVPLDAQETVNTARATSVLLDCAHGMMLEVDRRSADATAKKPVRGTAVSFTSNDVDAMAIWLRSKHVHIDGTSNVLTQGGARIYRVVYFQAPWGQPLQLIGPLPKEDVLEQRASRLAAQ